MKKDHVVEIAAMNPQNGDTFARLVKLEDEVSMSPKAEEVTGITSEELREAHLPSFEHVIKDFWQFVNAQYEDQMHIPLLVGHNIIKFDMPLLWNRMEELHLDSDVSYPDEVVLLDTLLMSKRLIPGLDSYSLNNLHYLFKGTDIQGAHRALSDVHGTVSVFQSLIRLVSGQEVGNQMDLKSFCSDKSIYGEFVKKWSVLPSTCTTVKENDSSGLQISEPNWYGLVSREDLLELGDNLDQHVEEFEHDVSDVSERFSDDEDLVRGTDAAHLSSLCLSDLHFTATEKKDLAKLQMSTVKDILFYFPRSYLIRSVGLIPRLHVDVEQALIVPVYVESNSILRGSGWCMLKTELRCLSLDSELLQDSNNIIIALQNKNVNPIMEYKVFRRGRSSSWVVQREHEKIARQGKIFCVSVRAIAKDGAIVIKDGSMEIMDLEEYKRKLQGKRFLISPVYPQKASISSQKVALLVRKTLRQLEKQWSIEEDVIPLSIQNLHGFLSVKNAVLGMHEPRSSKHFDICRRSLAFSELFIMQIKYLQGLNRDGPACEILDQHLQVQAMENLNFQLTPGQQDALSQINLSLASPRNTITLLQGDVGCGKTIIALLAAFAAVGSGYQVAFMAPTEVLAEQHCKSLQDLIHNLEPKSGKAIQCTILTGSTKSRDRREILQRLESGEIDIIIGTHSLISTTLQYRNLGLAIIDEQHKFGVSQRAALLNKSIIKPHILNMSATPIPRSLALVLYGEMNLVSIKDKPPGRTPVETRVMVEDDASWRLILDSMMTEIEQNGKVFVVCPRIEQRKTDDGDEEEIRTALSMQEILRRNGKFDPESIGVLHGRMNSQDKEKVLDDFVNGSVDILVSTTVIEVGVNVPEASFMVVVHSEFFGLAQLHQLRGRVGRGTKKSKCYLLTSGADNLDRLSVLEETENGFDIAHADLLNRGCGDLIGVAQSGHNSFGNGRLWELPRDSDLVSLARKTAEEFVHSPDSWPKSLQAAVSDHIGIDGNDTTIISYT